jgi:hypothetical protein
VAQKESIAKGKAAKKTHAGIEVGVFEPRMSKKENLNSGRQGWKVIIKLNIVLRSLPFIIPRQE